MMKLPWKCQECGEEFTTEKREKIHVDVVLKGEVHPYGCKLCDFIGASYDNLRRHLKKHTGEKSNKCSHCDYASSQAGHLRTHMKTHTGEKSNKCSQCDYASSQAGNLRRHLKTHSGEK